MTRHILKIAPVQTSKRSHATETVNNKYKAFKEVNGGQSCMATAKKYGVAKNG